MSTFDQLFELQGYFITQLGPETIPTLQGFLERCADYHQLVSGEPPDPNAAISLLAECPPGRTIEDKAVIGISSTDGNLVGVLDAMRDYPQAECWWLGLLLLDPAARNLGLGRQIFSSFERWVQDQGARYILLGVIEENEKACRFWQSVGFEVVEKQNPRQFGSKEHVVITMVRYLT